MKILIGSRALKFQDKPLFFYKPSPPPDKSDIDILGTQKDLDELIAEDHQFIAHKRVTPMGMLINLKVKGTEPLTIDFEIANHTESGQMYHEYMATQNIKNTTTIQAWSNVTVATQAMLYSLKRSHRYRPHKWRQHVADYFYLKERVGFIDVLDHITKQREIDIAEKLGKLKTPSLDATADQFFKDKVSNKIFIHDEIHEVMAHYDRPLFERIKKDPTKVACSSDKFLTLDYLDRVRCVQEEAYVIALERQMLPMLFAEGPVTTADAAFQWAVMRICTTLCSGWFREFALENLYTILGTYNHQYVTKFLEAVDGGKIRTIEKPAHSPDESQVTA